MIYTKNVYEAIELSNDEYNYLNYIDQLISTNNYKNNYFKFIKKNKNECKSFKYYFYVRP